MEIKLKDKNGKECSISMTPLLGRHTKKGFNKYASIIKGGQEDLKTLTDYLEYLDNLACELTGLKQDELDEFPSDEKQKILAYIQTKIKGKIDFLRPSKKQQDSGKQDT